MMDTKHTPGPWKASRTPHDQDSTSEISGEKKDGNAVAYVVNHWDEVEGNGEDTPETLANAALIAAAPDLLKALESLLRQTADPDPIHPAWAESRRRATEAIAQAMGA